MAFRRKTKVFLTSWVASKPEKESDPVFAKKTRSLDELQKTLTELQDSMQLYLASWQSMCQASAGIAEGLAKLAREGIDSDQHGNKASPLLHMARVYHSAQHSINEAIREPTHRVAEDMALHRTSALLSRFPPIYRKITRRQQLSSDFAQAAAKVRAADIAKEKERDRGDISGVAAEQRRKLGISLETAATVLNGVTQEVMADVDRLEEERGTMLVPEVSALVGCQAFFFRRSAVVLERATTSLPYSALALCRLVRPPGALLPSSRAASEPARQGHRFSTSLRPAHAQAPLPSSMSAPSSLNPFAGATAASAVGGGGDNGVSDVAGSTEADNISSSSSGLGVRRHSLNSTSSTSSPRPLPTVPLSTSPRAEPVTNDVRLGGSLEGGDGVLRRPLPPPPSATPPGVVNASLPLRTEGGGGGGGGGVMVEGEGVAVGSLLMASPPPVEEGTTTWSGDEDDDVVEEVKWG